MKKTKYPELKIHNFKPGSKARIGLFLKIGNLKVFKDKNGKTIASSKESHLFVSPNSKSINKKLFDMK